MTLTVVIGTAIVVMAAVVVVPLLLPNTREPATSRPLRTDRGPRSQGAPQVIPARLRPTVAERARGLGGLVIVSAGLGALTALVGAMAVLGLGTLLGR
jgi:hypothetical protein